MSDAPRIFVVHALKASLAPVADAFASGWPTARVCNLMDDALSRDRQSGDYSEEDFERRFSNLVQYCIASGAEGVLFACSAFNHAIEVARRGIRVPVLKPDEAMIARALDMGDVFAVVATFEPSIESLESQIRAQASSRKMSARVKSILVEKALQALNEGDCGRHDALIAEALSAIVNVDAVLLAQFSMARASALAAPRSPAPLLTSPASAVAKLRSMIVTS